MKMKKMTHQSIRWKIQEANFLFEKILWLFSPYYVQRLSTIITTHAAIIVYVVIHLLVPENLQQQQSIRPSQMKKNITFFSAEIACYFRFIQNAHLSFISFFFHVKKLLTKANELDIHSFIVCYTSKQANQLIRDGKKHMRVIFFENVTSKWIIMDAFNNRFLNNEKKSRITWLWERWCIYRQFTLWNNPKKKQQFKNSVRKSKKTNTISTLWGRYQIKSIIFFSHP